MCTMLLTKFQRYCRNDTWLGFVCYLDIRTCTFTHFIFHWCSSTTFAKWRWCCPFGKQYCNCGIYHSYQVCTCGHIFIEKEFAEALENVEHYHATLKQMVSKLEVFLDINWETVQKQKHARANVPFLLKGMLHEIESLNERNRVALEDKQFCPTLRSGW